MVRQNGPSVRARLALSYAGFVLIVGALVLVLSWVFLLGGQWAGSPIPEPSDFARILDTSNRGPRVFFPAALLLFVLMAVVGLVGGWILAGRMLAPLDRIAEATRTAARGSLSHRIGLRGRHDEFRELADAFDGMLARLEAHVAEQQRFAANVSHELRTPLAITQTLLDVARRDPARQHSELDERLRVVNRRAIELTEALLLLSRSDGRVFAREEFDLSLITEEATETLLPLADKYRVAIEVAGEVAPVVGSPALVGQMVSNLVHNAIVHNLTEGGWVRITTGTGAGLATLRVENTGKHLDPQLIPTLAEPFRRGTDRVRSDQAGAGLGLAIAGSIARAHEGSLLLGAGPDGGLTVEARLPLMQ